VTHVLQLGYDASGATGEDGAQLLWLYNYTGEGGSAQVAWINAVLGNSNITDLNLLAGTLSAGGTAGTIQAYLEGNRFDGSYDEYLSENNLTDPQLGKWGFDLDADKVWAVIDHNSSFVVSVPEPGSALLVLFGVASFALRRKKN
jgi:PEP-CTERM motif